MSNRLYLLSIGALVFAVGAGCGRHAAQGRNPASAGARIAGSPALVAPSAPAVVVDNLADLRAAEMGITIESEDRHLQETRLDQESRLGTWSNLRPIELERVGSDTWKPVFMVIPAEMRGVRFTEVEYTIVRERFGSSGFTREPEPEALVKAADYAPADRVWRLPLHRIREDFPGVDPLEWNQIHLRLKPQSGATVQIVTQIRLNVLDVNLGITPVSPIGIAGTEIVSPEYKIENLGHRPRQIWVRAAGQVTMESAFQRQWNFVSTDDRRVHPGLCWNSASVGLGLSLPSQMPLRPRPPRTEAGTEALAGIPQVQPVRVAIDEGGQSLSPVGNWIRVMLNPRQITHVAIRNTSFSDPAIDRPGDRCTTSASEENIDPHLPFETGRCDIVVRHVHTNSCSLASVRRIPAYQQWIVATDLAQAVAPTVDQALRLP